MTKKYLPAEWAHQRFVQFTFPHRQTDWISCWEEAVDCFRKIIQTALQYQAVVVVCQNAHELRSFLGPIDETQLQIVELSSNDTWARDYGGITLYEDNQAVILDFAFNGWGLKFPANLDNLITQGLHDKGVFGDTNLRKVGLVLEGGSIESDGEGTLLSTSHCLLSPNRNPHLSKTQIEATLTDLFGLKRLLWLESGHLAGDDTDAHIDTLARFCNPQTIAYVQCTDRADEHFDSLQQMERELKAFRQLNGAPYQLVPLPLPSAIFAKDGHRLPATYANFLILNGAVLIPVYGSTQDAVAVGRLAPLFPNREIVAVDCRTLIEQHGSLHCVSMGYY